MRQDYTPLTNVRSHSNIWRDCICTSTLCIHTYRNPYRFDVIAVPFNHTLYAMATFVSNYLVHVSSCKNAMALVLEIWVSDQEVLGMTYISTLHQQSLARLLLLGFFTLFLKNNSGVCSEKGRKTDISSFIVN